MKKLILATLFVLGFTGVYAQMGNDNDLIGQARGAAHAAGCFDDVPNGVQVTGTVQHYIYICAGPNGTYETFGAEVTLYAPTPCPPNQTCIQVIVPIATVRLNACDNRADVTCLDNVIIQP